MIKTKAIWKFFYHCLFYNYFFIFVAILLIAINVGMGVVFNLLVKDDLLMFNKLAFIFIQVTIIVTLIFVVTSIFYLFNTVKNNDMQAFLILSPYSRSKLFFQKNFFIFTCFICFALFNLLAQVITSIVFNHWDILLLSIILFALSVIIVFIFGPFITLMAIVGKSTLFVLISSLTILFIPATFLISRFVSPINQNDYLNYDLAHNQNNYVKMNIINPDQSIEEQYLLGIKNYEKQVNKNLSNDLKDSLNPTKNDFAFIMIGDVFNQFVADLLPKPIYNQEQLYKLSSEDYLFNLNLITTKNYLSGDPSELNNLTSKDVAYIAYQDQDPFEMTYEQILKGIIKVIEEIELTSANNIEFINSIFEKTNDDSSWSNAHFSEQELNILQTFAGKSDSWLFYFLKYKDFLTHKSVKLFKDIRNLYGEKIGDFSEFLWKENKFFDNVIKNQNVLSSDFINNNFPDVGTIDNKKNANAFDINYFKNVLIHFENNSSENSTAKVLTTTNGYQEINLIPYKDQIEGPDNLENAFYKSLTSYQKWNDYIDDNLEIVNLEIIYNKLFGMNQFMPSNYSFKNNQSDFYAVNNILEIETKPWINNSWLIIVVLVGVSFLIGGFTFLLNTKKGTKYA